MLGSLCAAGLINKALRDYIESGKRNPRWRKPCGASSAKSCGLALKSMPECSVFDSPHVWNGCRPDGLPVDQATVASPVLAALYH